MEKDESFYLILFVKEEILTDGYYEITISKTEKEDKKPDDSSVFGKPILWSIALF